MWDTGKEEGGGYDVEKTGKRKESPLLHEGNTKKARQLKSTWKSMFDERGTAPDLKRKGQSGSFNPQLKERTKRLKALYIFVSSSARGIASDKREKESKWGVQRETTKKATLLSRGMTTERGGEEENLKKPVDCCVEST